MPVDLHQRLSEYSYGYGVTREVERCLETVGLNSVPFLPNLIEEASLGFDVGFDRPGIPLLLQFKLGESLQRFIRSDPALPKPILNNPFWRFKIDTAEENGQFDLLFKADQSGAEVYYVAPKFSDWTTYATAFENGEILQHSLLLKPSEIDTAMALKGMTDGFHRIVYDEMRVYICSEPAQIYQESSFNFAEQLKASILSRNQRLSDALKLTFEGLQQHRKLRLPSLKEKSKYLVDEELHFSLIQSKDSPSSQDINIERQRRLSILRERSKSEDDAFFAAMGIESWAMGSQLIAVTLDD